MLWLPDHPNATKSGYVREHIVVMATQIGRPLTPNETVHHRNGVRSDNRPRNLELWASRHPRGQRIEDHVAEAVDVLRMYRPELLNVDLIHI